ncbi:MAG: DoxX family protein [Cognatishimia sp.]
MNKIKDFLLDHLCLERFWNNHMLLLLTLFNAFFLLTVTGYNKVTGHEFFVMFFENDYGYPLWFMFLIGWAEVFGAISLFLKRWAIYGALGLELILLGASTMHFFRGDELGVAGLAYFMTVTMAVVIYYHWKAKAGEQALQSNPEAVAA